jgi:hypothetical protein
MHGTMNMKLIDVSLNIKVRSIYKSNRQEQNKVEDGSKNFVIWAVKPCSLLKLLHKLGGELFLCL